MIRFYVAKNGCDDNSGTKDCPFCTLGRAQEAVRQFVAAGLRDAVTVTVEEGEYLVDGIVLNAADSGTEEFPIIWEAQGKVVINGGIVMNGADFETLNEEEKARLCPEAADRVRKIALKKYGLTRKDWGEVCAIGSFNSAHMYDSAVLEPESCELFVDDRRMLMARYPNEGFLYTKKGVRDGKNTACDALTGTDPERWRMLRNIPGDIWEIDADTAKRAAAWKSLKDVWIFEYPLFDWADMSSPVAGINAETNQMETVYIGDGGIRDIAPYYFFNVFEEMDTPGEWYLDRENGILYVYPFRALEESEINLSITTRTLLKIDGATDVTIKGFTFTATRGDAVDIRGDRNTVDGCEIKNVAKLGLRMDGNHCTVKNCQIHHTGRGGVQMIGGDRITLTPSGSLVTNNHIHHISEVYRTYQPGISLAGCGIVASHNCIHDSAHMAIGYGGNDHIIEYNEIYRVCQIADDSGAIYSGRDYTACGNQIRYNYFHDMSSTAENPKLGIFSVYCDDNMAYNAVYGNIMHRCQCSLLFHGGHDMIFKNNLIIDSCKQSTYSLRHHLYLYGEDLENENGTHAQNMAKVPWNEGIWKEKYPHLAEYLTWEPLGEQCQPHYCDISNNAIINHVKIDVHLFNCFDEKLHNTFKNNVEIADRAFAGIPEGDELDLSNNRLAQIIPGFEELPFDKMGMLTEL